MKIFLIGYMGAGKTTLGKKLSKELSLNFIDLDQYIEKKHKASIPFIFNLVGQDGFRLIEHRTLSEVINFDNCIISTGGGTPCFFDNINRLLESGLVIYLRMPSSNLVKRLETAKRKRPLISSFNANKLFEFVDFQLKEREIYYNQANLIIDIEKNRFITLVQIIKDQLKNF